MGKQYMGHNHRAAVASLTLGISALAWASGAQAQNAATTTPPSLRLKQVTQDIAISADGRSEMTIHSELQVLTAAAVTSLSQLPVPYNATIQDAEVLDAYTQKADGRKIPVDRNNILTQKAPGIALAPIYSDGEQKIIVFPDVEAGDTLVYSAKLSDKEPVLPGQYTLAHYLNTTIEADQLHYSITVPKTMPLAVDSRDMTQDVSTQGDSTTYRWSFSNLTAKARPTSLVSEPDTQVHFAVSTFKDYDAFAHNIATRVLDKVAVSPTVQNQADAITTGIDDKRSQARAIYDWINQHVRYVGIELGVGGLIPHEADWTLTNAFGDCKDQAVLFAALLKAKNIRAELVLINAGNRYSIGRVPTAGEFNHAIVWLPDFNLYADTTLAYVPFGLLPMADYGKPVLHIVATGAAQHATPVIPAGLLSSTYKVHAVMDAQRRFSVDVSVAATGPWISELRRLGADIDRLGPVAAASAILKVHRFPNATGTLNPSPTGGSASGYSISGNFSAGRLVPQANILALANGLRLLAESGSGPMGPLNNTNLTDTDETPCYSAHQSEDISVDFSDGNHLAQAPTDVHVKTANLSYDTHWSVDGNMVSLHREFVTTIDRPICSGQIRKETAAALAKIRDDYATPTRLAPPANDPAQSVADQPGAR
jgi:hypothetical protein